VISENKVSLPRRERGKSKPPHLYPLPKGRGKNGLGRRGEGYFLAGIREKK